jgi:hypothetical protein
MTFLSWLGEELVKSHSVRVRKVLIREGGSWTLVSEDEMKDMGDEPSTREIWLDIGEYDEK